MWNMDTTNMSQTSYERDYSKVPIDMCYRRTWTYQGMGVSKALDII